MQDDSDMDDEVVLLLASIAQLPEVFKSFFIFSFRIFFAVLDPDLSQVCIRILVSGTKKPRI
jgi:hypothetical protein